MKNEMLSELSRDQLIELIDIYSKNWLALDGVWFQSVESRDGMDAAMFHDARAWERYTVIEANRIRKFLSLGEHPGLRGLEKALQLRFYANLNEASFEYPEEGRLIYTMKKCRVQTARERKGMPWHPCKPVGVIEYSGFAKAIDDRISCSCLSCFPDVNAPDCCCKWEFILKEESDINRESNREIIHQGVLKNK